MSSSSQPVGGYFGAPSPYTPAVNTVVPPFTGFPLSLNLGSANLIGMDGITSRAAFLNMQAALNTRGYANGLAGLDADGYVPLSQLRGVPLTGGSIAKINLTGPGSTGDVSGMSVPLASGATGALGQTVPVLDMARSEIAARTIPLRAFAVSGFATSGDIGSGGRYVRGTSAGPMAIQDAAGTWWNLSCPDRVINPGWFGAKGDGNTDDTAALQAALNYLSTLGGGTLLFPAAAGYVVTSALSVNPRACISVLGGGIQATLIQAKFNNGSLFVFDNSAGPSLSAPFRVANLKMQNFFGFTPGDGILILGGGSATTVDYRAQYFILENLDISGFQKDIHIEKATNFVIQNIFPRGSGYGLYLIQCGDCLISGIKSGSNSLSTIYTDGGKPASAGWGEGLFITHCALNVDGNAININNQDFVHITSVQCGSTTNGAVLLQKVSFSVITACEISNTLGNNAGLQMDANCSENRVIGCTVDNCSSYGMVIRGVGHVIANNNFIANGTVTTNAQDILILASGSVVSANRCKSTPTSGTDSITESGGNYNVFDGNVCRRVITKTGTNSLKGTNVESSPV